MPFQSIFWTFWQQLHGDPIPLAHTFLGREMALCRARAAPHELLGLSLPTVYLYQEVDPVAILERFCLGLGRTSDTGWGLSSLGSAP